MSVPRTDTVKHIYRTFERIFISVFNQLDAQNLFHSKFHFMPLHISSTCARTVMHGQQNVKTLNVCLILPGMDDAL